MPSKMAACCKEKAVLVVVYEETSRRIRSPPENNRHRRRRHHHHHLHLHDDNNQQQPSRYGGGYSRRAELLEYSRRLRLQSPQSQSGPYSSPPKPAPTNPRPPPPITQTTAVRIKPEVQQARVLTCLGNLQKVIPAFLQPMTQYRKKKTKKKKKKKKKKINGESTTIKIKGAIQTFQVKRKGGSLSKFLATLQKHKQ